MPAKDDVQSHVLNFINAFTNINVDDLTSKFLDTKLTDAPFEFDNPSTAALTLTLRGYIQNTSPSQTILVTEVRSDGLTLQGLIDLVFSKFK